MGQQKPLGISLSLYSTQVRIIIQAITHSHWLAWTWRAGAIEWAQARALAGTIPYTYLGVAVGGKEGAQARLVAVEEDHVTGQPCCA